MSRFFKNAESIKDRMRENMSPPSDVDTALSNISDAVHYAMVSEETWFASTMGMLIDDFNNLPSGTSIRDDEFVADMQAVYNSEDELAKELKGFMDEFSSMCIGKLQSWSIKIRSENE